MRFLARRSRRGADLLWMPDRPALAAALADPAREIGKCRNPSEALRRRLVLWHVGGSIGSLAGLRDDENNVATADQLVALAAIQAEAGSLTIARQLVERALVREANVLNRLRFAGLTAGLHAIAPDRFAHFAPEVAATKTFRENCGAFRQLVEANADSICVVGNAPSEVGLGRGSLSV